MIFITLQRTYMQIKADVRRNRSENLCVVQDNKGREQELICLLSERTFFFLKQKRILYMHCLYLM